MKWITDEEATEAARTKKGAIAASLKKWDQLARATKQEMLDLDSDEPPCALCKRYIWGNFKHASCPLYKESECTRGRTTCCAEYETAARTRMAWEDNEAPSNWRKWRKAARAMRDKIEALNMEKK